MEATAVVTISDEGLQRAFLAWIYRSLEEGRMQDLLRAGISTDTLDSLRRLSAPNLEALCKGGLGFSIYVDDANLQLAIRRANERQRNAERIEYYVRHGAPVALVVQLFRLSNTQINCIRESLLPPDECRGGRQSLPEDRERDKIHAAWALLGADTTVDPRDHWIILHQKFTSQYSIATLHAVVNEFSTPAPTSKRA